MTRAGTRAGPVLWAAVVLLTALPPLAAAYSAGWTVAVLAGCVLAPVGLAVIGRAVRVPRWVVATAGMALAVVVALVFADRVDPASGVLPSWRSSPGFSALGPLIDAVPRLLTAPRPAPADPSLLVPVALLTWTVALAVAVAVVGGRRAGVAPLFGAVALHLAGALLTAGRGDLLGTSALATGVALLLGWVLLPAQERPAGTQAAGAQGPPARASGSGRGVVLPAVVVAVVASFALTAVAIPTARSFEPRTLVPPPELPVDAANPIPQSALWALQPDAEMFSLAAVEGELPERVAVAVLPDYDGVAWTLDAELRPVGVVAEPDTAAARTTRSATYTVTAEGYTEAWFPAAGTATSLAGATVLMDVDTGTLVAAGGWRTGDVTVTTTINAATPDAIGQASVPQPGTMSRYLALPRVPPAFADTARTVTDGVSSRWEQISRLADAVRTSSFDGRDRVLDHGARSGSSYQRLADFLFDPVADGGQVGTSEQFAASFAVLARTLGIPTRLVVGFEVPPEGAAEGAATVRGEHSRVWAEVYLAGIGWVAVDPSPDASISTDLATPQPEPEMGDDPEPKPDQTDGDASVIEPEEPQAGRGSPVFTWIAGGTLALALLGTLGLAVARAARRRRWRAGGETGAWAQVEDAVRLSGGSVPAGTTAPDLAAGLPSQVSGSAVALAERAEERAYAPHEPAGSDAWALAREVDRGLRREASWRHRLLWWVSPRVWRR